MKRDITTRILFVILLLVFAWSAFRVIAPFVAGLTWAAVLVVTFRPFHRRLEHALRGRTWAATALVTLAVAAFVVVPIVVAAVQAVQGGIAAFAWVQQAQQAGALDSTLQDGPPWMREAVADVKRLVGLATVDLRAAAISGLRELAQFVAVQGPALVGGALGLAFSFVVMVIGIPLLFAHGETLSEGLAEAMPIPTSDATRILRDLGDMTRSVFLSVGLTAATQAALGGLALVVLGVPRAVPLTAVMFFLAFLPGGVALVWAPVALWLAATGQTWSAVALAGWGAGVVGTIDNVLRPLLAGRGVKLDGATLFLGMFGGMVAFGLIGLFLGPIVLHAARELVGILRRDIYAAPVEVI